MMNECNNNNNNYNNIEICEHFSFAQIFIYSSSPLEAEFFIAGKTFDQELLTIICKKYCYVSIRKTHWDQSGCVGKPYYYGFVSKRNINKLRLHILINLKDSITSLIGPRGKSHEKTL